MSHTIKRAFDIVGSITAAMATSPILVGTAIAIRSTMGAPVLFRQTRPGLNGRPFELLKFRTMRSPKSGDDEVANDSIRITKLGKILRAASLDELPTLLNVIRGDMSLVGPRPLLMRYLGRYTPEQFKRHNVKPGVTGWAQINGRNTIGWEEKFDLDIWYVRNQSLLLDTKILLSTVLKVVLRVNISHGDNPTMPEFMGTSNNA